jgi:hypothetical protein
MVILLIHQRNKINQMETDRGRCSSDRDSTHGTIHYFVMLKPITSHAKKDIVR